MLDVQAMTLPRSPSSGSVAEPLNMQGWPAAVRVPWLMERMLAEGGLFEATAVTVREALAVLPWLSVTFAVIVWNPGERETVTGEPVPRVPTIEEVQVMAVPRFPSSVSVALAVRVKFWPLEWERPAVRALIEIWGGAL